MSQEILVEQLQALEKKLHKLVIKCNTYQKENERLVEENIQLQETVKKQKEELDTFHNQENFSSIVASIATGTEDTVELKKKLDEYIDEVDKCIALLGK
ncbi:hypothetical protein [Eisenibacter elegans]|jgi:ABC-type phosphate transport system auxiliary subunit|uniref:hypothetical protein n=1 Tax=Eisenibacter elegans TaxID=997 RepID=UPI0004223EB4|nr:hypothetical protein [Eisenibacter elegans]